MKGIPEASDMAIVRALMKKYPLIFTSIDNTRSKVRRIRGTKNQRGGGNKVKNPLPRSPFTRENPYNLPESHAEELPPFVLPVACNNILVLSDLHIPYHNIKAITTAIKYGQDEKVNCIIINGDLLDFYMYSKFQKDPRKRSAKHEIEAGIDFLTQLRSLFPHIPIYWIKGNHDIRYELFLKSVAPMLFEDQYYQLEDRMGLAKLKIRIFDDRTIIKAGHLNILHGHTIFKMSPQNPAQTAVTRFPSANLLFGHTHKITEFTTNVWDRDKIYTVYSSGCLCELRPEYDSVNVKNSHGFAHVKILKDGFFNCKNIRVFNGRIL